ncbi:MAG: DUF5658 family protein [Methylomonas sp.]|nr:DUF5658 family protein [Methylomonas sp.]
MNINIRHSIESLGLFFLKAVRNFASSYRCLCFSNHPALGAIWGMEPKRLKYLLNTSLILVFALLHTADGIITYLGLKFDTVDEANPVLVFFAGTMGLGVAIFLLKLLCLEFIAVLYFARRNIKGCLGTMTLLSADAFYSWVVSNNILLVAAA